MKIIGLILRAIGEILDPDRPPPRLTRRAAPTVTACLVIVGAAEVATQPAESQRAMVAARLETRCGMATTNTLQETPPHPMGARGIHAEPGDRVCAVAGFRHQPY
jgi:hypothetical protein